MSIGGSVMLLGGMSIDVLDDLVTLSLGRGDYGTLVKFEFVAEEIVRTLVGSLGLIAAVPLMTVIASLFALRADSPGNWREILGPLQSGESHSH